MPARVELASKEKQKANPLRSYKNQGKNSWLHIRLTAGRQNFKGKCILKVEPKGLGTHRAELRERKHKIRSK